MAEAKDEGTNAEKQTPDVGRPSYLRGPLPKKSDVQLEGETVAPTTEDLDEGSAAKVAKKDVQAEDVELYSWKVWLLPLRPWISVLVVASIIGCLGLEYWAFPQLFFVLIMAVILLNRLAVYLFPVKYVLTEETVGFRTFLARDIRSWDKVLTYYEFEDGVLVSHDTRTVRGRLKSGLFLYYYPDGSNKEQVLQIVKSKLKPPDEAFVEKDRLIEQQKKEKGGVGSAIERTRKVKSKK